MSRYIQIALTCFIAGSLTYAFKQEIPKSSSTFTIEHKEDGNIPHNSSTIVLEPEILSDDISYKYGFVHYSPTEIALSINDQEIKINNRDPIVVKVDKDNTVTTRCKYKFIKGYEGEKTFTWKVRPGVPVKVTFDWNSKEKIQIQDAELITIER